MNIRITLVLLLISAVAACGFQLRGSNLDVLQNSTVYVQSNGADQLTRHVRQQLGYAGVGLINSAEEADYVVQLSNESFDRSILAVSPTTGTVEQYELLYKANLSVSSNDGKQLLTASPITAQRDYIFDDGALLGNFEQESVLREDITRQAASGVLRQLEAVTQ